MLDRKFWEKYFAVYDILNELSTYQELGDKIIDELDIERGDKILDLGSGTGNIALKAKKKGAEVIGIDSSPEGVKIHKEKMPDSEIILGDITEKLPFEGGFFDKIYSSNVIYTIPEEKRKFVFDELYRIIKPGGIIVISNPKIGFKPLAIYLDHVKKEIKERGFFLTFIKGLKLMIPTIKMFYYNIKIKRENKGGDYRFMEPNDQKNYLTQAGFKNISENKSVYADQAILNKAEK
ncbi:MAG TPA: class I SAM-dependent methyltransferase [Candidatus Vogelbacteria bacterium]|nr:class I SAM-dependent methyltransferase [Candidatus Vogelbacteria bacterium]